MGHLVQSVRCGPGSCCATTSSLDQEREPILNFETTEPQVVEYGKWQELIPEKSKLIKIRGKKPATEGRGH